MPNPQLPPCANCGRPIVPFGRFGQLFHYDAIGTICLECAKSTIPSRVAEAEQIEAALTNGEKD